MKTKLLGALIAVVCGTGVAQAAVVHGAVTKGGGSFEMIDTAGLTVGKNNQQSKNLFAFNEVQNFTLTSDLTLDHGKTIKAGTRVSSHYVFYDPARLSRQHGVVSFSSTVLGLATSTEMLGNTDFLGLSSVTYLSPALRGLEAADDVGIDGTDPNQITVNWRAGSPGDYIRVITAAGGLSVVPVPASGLLLAGALGFVALRRRKKS